jgi:hypothetical protein
MPYAPDAVLPSPTMATSERSPWSVSTVTSAMRVVTAA